MFNQEARVLFVYLPGPVYILHVELTPKRILLSKSIINQILKRLPSNVEYLPCGCLPGTLGHEPANKMEPRDMYWPGSQRRLPEKSDPWELRRLASLNFISAGRSHFYNRKCNKRGWGGDEEGIWELCRSAQFFWDLKTALKI